jgi:hypothetical protein
MTIDERQIALTVLEHIRDDVQTATTSDGLPINNYARLHQYVCEKIKEIRTHEEFKVSRLIRGRPDGKAEVPGEQVRY